MMLLAFVGACASPTPERSGADPLPLPLASVGPTTLSAEQIRAVEEALAADLAVADATGASIALWRDGEVVYRGVQGVADPATGALVTPDTRFCIGSDTKKITAIAVLQAIQRGELSLDDTVLDVLPDLVLARAPGWSAHATIRDLLTHQGGLYDYTPWETDPDDHALADRVYGEFADGEFPMSDPGAFWNYSNPNYALLGLVIEAVTGRPWADVVEHDVFRPLGMTHTVARQSEVPDGQKAIGTGYLDVVDSTPFDWWTGEVSYTFGVGPEIDNAFLRPAGLVWSTPTDLAKLAGFLVEGDPDVLDDALRAEITVPQVAEYPPLGDLGGSYGYGMTVYPWLGLDGVRYDTPLWLHGGNTLTMTSTFWVLPELRLAVSVLGNGYDDTFVPTVVAAIHALDVLPRPRRVPAPPLPRAGSFVGSWADPYGVGTLTVTSDRGLRVDAPDLDAAGIPHGALLLPVADGFALFSIDGGDHELTWLPGETGEGHWVRDRSFVGRRGPSGPLPLRAAGPRVPRALSEAFR